MLVLFAQMVFVNLCLAQKPIYHKGWVDFNKNGKMDVFEDPSQPIDKRIADLLKGLEFGKGNDDSDDLEDLLEAIIQLHSTSPSFKNIFKSTQVTQQFIDAHSAFASVVKSLPEISQRVTSLMDKMCHLAIALVDLLDAISQTGVYLVDVDCQLPDLPLGVAP